jgi:hypothetical protein
LSSEVLGVIVFGVVFVNKEYSKKPINHYPVE